jgi:hypothetical protein
MFYNKENLEVEVSKHYYILDELKKTLISFIRNRTHSTKDRQIAAKHAAMTRKMISDDRTTDTDIRDFLNNVIHFFNERNIEINAFPAEVVEHIKSLDQSDIYQVKKIDVIYLENQIPTIAADWLIAILEFQLLVFTASLDSEHIKPATVSLPQHNIPKVKELKLEHESLLREVKTCREKKKFIPASTLIKYSERALSIFKINRSSSFQVKEPHSLKLHENDLKKIIASMHRIDGLSSHGREDNDILLNPHAHLMNQPDDERSQLKPSKPNIPHIIEELSNMLGEIGSSVKKRKDKQLLSCLQTELSNYRIMGDSLNPHHLVNTISKTKTLLSTYSKEYRAQHKATLRDFTDNLLHMDVKTAKKLSATQIKQMLSNLVKDQLIFFPPNSKNIRAHLKHSFLESAMQRLNEVEADYLQVTESIRCALYQHTSLLFTCGKPHSLKVCENQINLIADHAGKLN